MAIIAYAVPILPGQSDAAAAFEADLDEAGHRARYEALNRAAGLTRHLEWVQEGPDGDLLIVVFDTPKPERLGRAFDDSDEYDRWWRTRFERIHGFDPANGTLPRPTVAWSATD